MEKQSTHLNCIIYPEEHNGTVLLTYEACTKQLASPPSNLDKTTTVTLSTLRVNKVRELGTNVRVYFV